MKNIGKNLYTNYTYKRDEYGTLKPQFNVLKDEFFHKTEYYLAYGSNLNLGQLAHRCPDAKHIGNIEKKDWRLVFRGVADIEPHKGSTLVAGIFKISEADEVALDKYEGYPSLYKKAYFDYKLEGQPIKIMYYYMSTTGIAKPSAYYYKTILQGYLDCGLDLDYLTKAYKETLMEITEDTTGCYFPKRWKKTKRGSKAQARTIVNTFKAQLETHAKQNGGHNA